MSLALELYIAVCFVMLMFVLLVARPDIKAWAIRMSDVYPPRWFWPVVRIYGGPDGQESRVCYMTRLLLGPATPWGQAYLHIFHREDMDRDPHDHPFAFWTMPLNQGYVEEVFDHARGEGCFKLVDVPRLRISFRRATHTHRVVATAKGRWPLVTLVWRSTNMRKWGFWCHASEWSNTERHFVPYKEYVYDGVDANVGGADDACPGTSGRMVDVKLDSPAGQALQIGVLLDRAVRTRLKGGLEMQVTDEEYDVLFKNNRINFLTVESGAPGIPTYEGIILDRLTA